MKYTVLTYIPRRPTPPAIGMDVAGVIREVGCAKCVVDKTTSRLKACWQHKNERILWAVTVEGPEEEENNVQDDDPHIPEISRVAEVGPPTGVEELVEVS